MKNLKSVMHYFEEISSIPRGSGNTDRICDYCVNFAKEHDLKYYRDEHNNCIIEKSSGSGESVILQGHIDMVCEKTEDCTVDMENEGLRLKNDGEYIWADKTTLGGDDGIAVAMILAILASDDLTLPPIYAVLTSDEEIGMLGAQAIDMSGVRAKRLINIDSEEEGVFTVGCAGGCTAVCGIPVDRHLAEGDVYTIKIGGLTGGHSGTEINRGRLNAINLLCRVLKDADAEISRIEGGGKDNAIAVSAFAEVIGGDNILSLGERFEKIFSAEAPYEDKNVYVKTEKVGRNTFSVLDKSSSERAVNMLISLPNGVQTMSTEIDGLVRTSLNMGILKTESDNVSVSFCVRSMLGSEKKMLLDKIDAVAGAFGGDVKISGDYPAWEYSGDSRLCRIMTDVFRKQYKKEPKIEAIHAGLECGLFCGKIENLECVSIGPDISDIHTPKEKLDIKSTERVWNFLLDVLEQMHGEI